MTSYTIEQDHFLINGVKTYEEYVNCPQKYKGLLMNADLSRQSLMTEIMWNSFSGLGKRFLRKKIQMY